MNPAAPNPLPLVLRELRVAGRWPGTYRWRLGCGAAGMGFAVWSFLAWGSGLSTGRWIFQFILFSAALLALFAGVFAASDTVSRERREGTLGFLFLTDLGAADIVLGKFAAAALLPASMLLALLPALALCQLVGGVPGAEIGRGALALGAALVFSMSVAVLVSTLVVQQRAARSLSTAVLLVVNPVWLCVLGLDAVYPAAPVVFWAAWLAALALSALCLGAAVRRLSVSWRRAADYARARGASESRAAGAAIGGDPVSWMMARRSHSRRTVLFANVFALLAVAASLWAIGPARWIGSLLLLFVLHLAWMLAILSRTAHAFQADREEGSLELLLATRLDVAEIFSGFNRHLQGQNRVVLACFAGMDLLHALLFLGWGREKWAALPLAMGAVLWVTVLGLGWTGVYRALLTDHPPIAMSGAFNRLAMAPLIVSAIVILGSSNVLEGSIFWVVSAGFAALFFGMDASAALRKHGRELLLRPRKDPIPHIENEWSFINWDDLRDADLRPARPAAQI